jgi:hypothetical protein
MLVEDPIGAAVAECKTSSTLALRASAIND